jgi:SNF2 family DNA or RNA helicase
VKYQFKTTPYAHQVAAIEKLLSLYRKGNNNGALLMAPRTGKTKVAIDWASILHQAGKVNRVVVVCPVSVIGVWVEEIATHCPVKHKIIVWDKDGRERVSLPPWQVNKLVFVIINYEAFQVPGAVTKRDEDGNVIARSRNRGGRFDMKKAFSKWRPHMFILDESHRIKSPRAKKSTMIQALGKLAEFRIIMTGTVLTKKKRVFDIYGQWLFLNPDSKLMMDVDGNRHNMSSFKKDYGVWTERNGYPQWLRNRNDTRLRKRLHADSFAVTRDECFDLPKAQYQIVPVKLTGHNAELYDEMAEEMVAKIKTGEITEASIKLVQGMRLAQLTSGLARTVPTDERPEGRLLRVGRDKLTVLEERLFDLFEADEHVIIGARWRGDIAAIAAMCGKMRGFGRNGVPAFELHGGVDRAQRDSNRRQFNGTDGPAAFIMQPQAGSMGIDLRSASVFIWFSLTNSWVDFTQSEDRNALSPTPVTYEYMLCEGTVDEVLYDELMQDGSFAKAITDSPDRLLRNFKKDWVPKTRRGGQE